VCVNDDVPLSLRRFGKDQVVFSTRSNVVRESENDVAWCNWMMKESTW
jgi:hypothetical protein